MFLEHFHIEWGGGAIFDICGLDHSDFQPFNYVNIMDFTSVSGKYFMLQSRACFPLMAELKDELDFE